MEKCEYCDGTGKVLVAEPLAPGETPPAEPEMVEVRCLQCDGTGAWCPACSKSAAYCDGNHDEDG